MFVLVLVVEIVVGYNPFMPTKPQPAIRSAKFVFFNLFDNNLLLIVTNDSLLTFPSSNSQINTKSILSAINKIELRRYPINQVITRF